MANRFMVWAEWLRDISQIRLSIAFISRTSLFKHFPEDHLAFKIVSRIDCRQFSTAQRNCQAYFGPEIVLIVFFDDSG